MLRVGMRLRKSIVVLTACPKRGLHPHAHEHASRHLHDGLVPLLHNSILLRRVARGDVPSDTLIVPKIDEVVEVKLTTVIRPKHIQLQPMLVL
jgi:hypothetical protein